MHSFTSTPAAKQEAGQEAREEAEQEGLPHIQSEQTHTHTTTAEGWWDRWSFRWWGAKEGDQEGDQEGGQEGTTLLHGYFHSISHTHEQPAKKAEDEDDMDLFGDDDEEEEEARSVIQSRSRLQMSMYSLNSSIILRGKIRRCLCENLPVEGKHLWKPNPFSRVRTFWLIGNFLGICWINPGGWAIARSHGIMGPE